VLYVRIALELLLAVVIVLAIIGIVWTLRRRQAQRRTRALPTADEQLANFDALLREHEAMRERMRPPPPEP
jgi:uncharacterized membrane protein YqjE